MHVYACQSSAQRKKRSFTNNRIGIVFNIDKEVVIYRPLFLLLRAVKRKKFLTIQIEWRTFGTPQHSPARLELYGNQTGNLEEGYKQWSQSNGTNMIISIWRLMKYWMRAASLVPTKTIRMTAVNVRKHKLTHQPFKIPHWNRSSNYHLLTSKDEFADLDQGKNVINPQKQIGDKIS